MKNFRTSIIEIYRENRSLLVFMILSFMLAAGLLVFSLTKLDSTSAVVKVGYGDIGRYQGGEWSSMANSGGYYDASWTEMLAFPALALIFGLLHNLLAVKLYSKKGAGVAQVFVIYSICLALATFVVLSRLLGEG